MKKCQVCQLVNVYHTRGDKGTWARGTRPRVYWETDFTEVKPGKYGYKCLLVFVDTFSGWMEAFPTKHETVYVVAKKILEVILPRFGVPDLPSSLR